MKWVRFVDKRLLARCMSFGKVIFFVIIHMSNGAEYINRDLVVKMLEKQSGADGFYQAVKTDPMGGIQILINGGRAGIPPY